MNPYKPHKHPHPARPRSLRKSLVFSFMLLSCALAAIFSYCVFGIVKQASTWRNDNFLQATSRSLERLEKVLADSQEAAQSAAYSAACQTYLLSSSATSVIESKRSATDLMSYISMYGESFKDVVLLSNRGRRLSITNSYTEIVELALGMVEIGDDLRFERPIYSPIILDRSSRYIVYLFPTYGNIDGYRYQFNPIAGAVIYDMEDLLQLARLDGYEDSISILENGKTVLGSSRSLSAAEASSLRSLREGQTTLAMSGTRYLIKRRAIGSSGLQLVSLLPDQATHLYLAQIADMPILLITLFLFSILVFSVGILRGLHSDIGRLTKNIRLTENSTTPIPPPRISELAPISDALNKTFATLREAHQWEQQLMADRHKAQLAQAEAEMLAYRSQINPHFLFNTLESARSLAHHYGAEPVEELVGGMSQMFRYSLHAPAIVPLMDELHHLDSYFSVIATRFPGRYRLLKDIPPKALTCPVPSMLLQPIMENTINHAFAGRMHGTILVQAFYRGNDLILRIADNGSGMDAAAVDALTHSLQDGGVPAKASPDSLSSLLDQPSKDVSIGLANIYHRLKLSFGEAAGLHIRSKEDYYTVIEVHIPPQQP